MPAPPSDELVARLCYIFKATYFPRSLLVPFS